MTVEIKVGPPVITISQVRTFMVATQTAEIQPDSDQGVYAIERFDAYWPPEVFAGLKRKGDMDFPVLYPGGANIPQDWATGSIFHMVRTMLGLRAMLPTRGSTSIPRFPIGCLIWSSNACTSDPAPSPSVSGAKGRTPGGKCARWPGTGA